jgi:hypothetical protein
VSTGGHRRARYAATVIVPTAAAVSCALWVAAAAGGRPHKIVSGIDVFGSSDRSGERFGRPLSVHLRLFDLPRRAGDRLPATLGPLPPLPVMAAHLKGDPGEPALSRSRRVTTPLGAMYVVPTAHGWACLAAATFETCHRGLLHQGIAWSFYNETNSQPSSAPSATSTLVIVGIAANDVTKVELVYGKHARTARLDRNVFGVTRPVVLTSIRHMPPLGELVISYREHGRRSARVSIR